MENEKLDRAITLLETAKSQEGFEQRLRTAHRAQRIIDSFIAEEARKANALTRKYGGLSWEDIGRVLELSRSAAFVRYSVSSKRNR